MWLDIRWCLCGVYRFAGQRPLRGRNMIYKKIKHSQCWHGVGQFSRNLGSMTSGHARTCHINFMTSYVFKGSQPAKDDLNTKLYTFNFNYLDKFDFWCENTYILNLVLHFTLIKYQLRDGFKTQPPVDRRFRPVSPGFHCSKQWQPPGTGRNRRSTGGWVLKPPLIDFGQILYGKRYFFLFCLNFL